MFQIADEELKYINSILDDIDVNQDILDDLNASSWDWVESYLPNDCGFASGATKGVIIPCDKNYVIKIPFKKCEDSYETEYCTGTWEQREIVHSNGEVSYSTEYTYVHFSEDDSRYCSNPTHNPFEYGYRPLSEDYTGDYCSVEEEYYEMATEEGLEDFFARTYCVNPDWRDCPVYVQEKVRDVFAEKGSNSSHSSEEVETTRSKVSSWGYDGRLALTFICDLILAYGEEKTKKFLDFLNRESSNLNDLHQNNYGYRLDGTPCLIDYSGFHD